MDIKKIMEKLENGVHSIFTSNKYAEYLETVTKFYQYSTNNTILIYMQMPAATCIAGYKDWQKKFGRYVRKGEHGIKIIAPCPHTRKETDDDGNETETKWISYKSVTVFDVSQTDGKPLSSIANMLTGNVDGFKFIMEQLRSISSVPIDHGQIPGTAFGYFSDSDKRIVIREGLPEQQEIKTTIHEIAHSILHCKDGKQYTSSREEKEIQAESIAYIVSNSLGIDTSCYSFGYIAGWSKNKDAKELTKHLTLIQETAKQILEKFQSANYNHRAA